MLIHPNYRGRSAWPGRRETSDLLYQDTWSALTRHLIDTGYLSGNVWAGATPEYLIEVKTTTGNCDDRFYMSSSQFRLVSQPFHLLHYRPLLTSKDARHGAGTRACFGEGICHFQSL